MRIFEHELPHLREDHPHLGNTYTLLRNDLNHIRTSALAAFVSFTSERYNVFYTTAMDTVTFHSIPGAYIATSTSTPRGYRSIIRFTTSTDIPSNEMPTFSESPDTYTTAC